MKSIPYFDLLWRNYYKLMTHKIIFMKKLIIKTAILFFSIFKISAQPNGGFENWSPYFNIENPDDWGTLNILTFVAGGNPQSVFKASAKDKHSGNYALKIKTVYFNNKPDYNAIKDTMGIVFTGRIELSPVAIKYGFPYSQRPEKLEFWAKYNPIGLDNAGAQVYLRKWDGSKNDTIAFGEIVLTETLAYTNFQVNLTYYSSDSPDSAIIAFASSNYTAIARVGSTLFVDDVAFVGTVGIDKQKNTADSFKILLNPANDNVIIYTQREDAFCVKIFDVSGKNVGTYKFENYNASINTSSYASGNYFFEIYKKNNNVLNSGKFNIAK